MSLPRVLINHKSQSLRDELESLELELMRRQSQSRSSEIKKIKDSHMLEFVDAENVWKEKVETLQAKVKLSPFLKYVSYQKSKILYLIV